MNNIDKVLKFCYNTNVMSETKNLSHPETLLNEVMTDEVLGDLLAAIGNHEAKAIVLGGMERGTAYGITALHQLFLLPQGDNPAHKGAVNNQMQYCTDSFEAVGFVAKAQFGESLKYEITEKGENEGKALAGHLLEFSLSHPDMSLRQIFGLTKSPGHKEQRAPVDRLKILRTIANSEEDLEAGDIEEKSGVSYNNVTHNLRWLDKHGIIRYETLNSRFLTQRPSPNEKLGGRRRSAIEVEPEMREVINKILAITDGLLSGDREFLEDGKKKLVDILSNENQVKELVSKAYKNSPEANRLPREVRFSKVAKILLAQEVATLEALVPTLEEEGLSKYATKNTLEQMRKLGLVESVLLDGQNIWAVKQPDSVTSKD